MQNQHLRQATRLFHSGQYQKGLEILSDCILTNPQQSMLYSNRALFYYQMKSNDNAINDLQTAIDINYLNYIAYFNLFSIELRVGGLEKQALEDLCCSLSILYFLRAKIRKTEIDIQKSLKYCQNNIQAHILKGMMHLENNKLKLAANSIQWALEFQPSNIVLKKLHYFLNSKIGYKNQHDSQSNPFKSTQRYEPVKRSRLQCSLQIDQYINIQQQIGHKLEEFAEIYNDLNCQNGTITQRILIGNDEILNVETSIISQVSGIWESGQKQRVFINREPAEQKFKKVLQKQSNQKNKNQILSEHQQEQIPIYDEVVLKSFNPDEEENLLYSQVTPQQYGTGNQKNSITPQSVQQIVESPSKSMKSLRRGSGSTDYFVANQREDFCSQSSQLKEESFEIPYQILNKKFTKKQQEQPYLVPSNHKIPSTKDICRQQESNGVSQPEKHQFILPQPQVLEGENSNASETTKYINGFVQQEKDGIIQSENKISHIKDLHKLKQQANIWEQSIEQKSEAIECYSSQNIILPNYGEILTKSNKNMQFHESQVMQTQSPVRQGGDNGQITLIDDLQSESSHKDKDSLDNFGNFEKKDSIEQKLQDIKDRVVKSLENSMKKKISNQSVSDQSETKTQDRQSQKSKQKFEVMELYPYTLPKKQICFKFSNIQFSKKSKVSQLDEIYLVGVYHLSIPKYKMKTQPRKVEGTFCHWNEKFPQMNLLQQQRVLKITVFNKAKGMKARDELQGEGEKQITQTGEVRLAMYEKKNLIGYVKFVIWAM